VNAGQMLRAGGIDSLRVRVLIAPVDPESVRVRSAPGVMRRLWGRDISAMTLGKTIFLAPALITAVQHRPGLLLIHELVHVRQWGELGVIRFLWRYLTGYLNGRWKGLGHHAAYLAIPLEVEARVAARLLG
jgi:Domain of unknown function (DUF4157)